MKRDPQIIAIWVAIAIICFTQIRSARHNYQMHHQFREQIQQIQEQHLNSLQALNDNLKNWHIPLFMYSALAGACR